MSIWTGFVDFYATILRSLADFFGFLGGLKWAAATVVLTVIVRTLLLPLAIKQIRGMRDMQRMQPEVARLKQKYAGDRQKLTQETMALYQREGVNPYATCLPMIAQMPIIFAFYQALQLRILKLPAHLKKAVDAKKMIGTAALVQAQALPASQGGIPEMPFFGLGDLALPASSTAAGWLLLAVMTAAQLLSTRQMNMGQTDQQKRIQMLMPIFLVFIFRGFPAILVLYWTTQNVYQLVQQMVMTRDMREKGWRGWLGLKLDQPKGKSKGQRGKSRNGQGPRKDTKPQVKAPIQTPEPVAAVVSGTSFDALASRRQLEAKRQRRRRNKKRKRRR